MAKLPFKDADPDTHVVYLTLTCGEAQHRIPLFRNHRQTFQSVLALDEVEFSNLMGNSLLTAVITAIQRAIDERIDFEEQRERRRKERELEGR